MDFVSNQKPQIEAMLKEIGVDNIEDLFAYIPKKLILPRPQTEDGLAECEGIALMQELAKKNTYPHYDNYLGAGAYEHYIPALVDAICSKSEFLTSYTPYQAEASQGMLQAIFEFQHAICALTSMDISNASLYDGASACAEAALMAMRINKARTEILVSPTLNPRYRAVVDQYLTSHSVTLKTLSLDSKGRIDKDSLEQQLSQSTIAVLLQSPNYLGIIEEITLLSPIIKAHGALLLLSGNPLSYGIYASPGELGVDIAVGDVQPFGLPLEFGGPYVGYLSCRKEYIRQLPGRLIGETLDSEGKRGFVLTLQAREQHIRREKATSNICTNQALAALASLIAIVWYGKQGITELAQTNFARASYLKNELSKIKGTCPLNSSPHFNEFAFSFGLPYQDVQEHFRRHYIEPGLHLGEYESKLENYFLIAVTETKTKNHLDRYLETAQSLASEKQKGL